MGVRVALSGGWDWLGAINSFYGSRNRNVRGCCQELGTEIAASAGITAGARLSLRLRGLPPATTGQVRYAIPDHFLTVQMYRHFLLSGLLPTWPG